MKKYISILLFTITMSSCCTYKGYVESFDESEITINYGGEFTTISNPTYKDSIYIGAFVKVYGTIIYKGRSKDMSW